MERQRLVEDFCKYVMALETEELAYAEVRDLITSIIASCTPIFGATEVPEVFADGLLSDIEEITTSEAYRKALVQVCEEAAQSKKSFFKDLVL